MSSSVMRSQNFLLLRWYGGPKLRAESCCRMQVSRRTLLLQYCGALCCHPWIQQSISARLYRILHNAVESSLSAESLCMGCCCEQWRCMLTGNMAMKSALQLLEYYFRDFGLLLDTVVTSELTVFVESLPNCRKPKSPLKPRWKHAAVSTGPPTWQHVDITISFETWKPRRSRKVACAYLRQPLHV